MINIRKFFKSFHYALQGIHYALNYDQNLVIHFIAALLVILMSVFLKVNPFEMGILGVTILVVISAEMINSAIEKMVDLITKEHRAEAKIAKDVSAGMVLLTAVGSFIIGVLIFVPHILKFFR
ncbi:diacylglycerol kinase family protein [Candidatus Roizmanbacteria bacterium]|nr:diacylglycerol kinase family protein [Candidatus Roizmanbacteria bacterium]